MSEHASDPYTAVIFTNQRRTGPGAAHDGYADMADRMEQLARQQPGFRGIESVRGADGVGITVSYFDSEQHARDWKRHAEHLEAQRLGRERWYDWYSLRVATVDREYSWKRPPTILHVALAHDWEAAELAGTYTTSTRGVTLASAGFIHCSFEDQVEATANRFYADLDELVLLRIDPARLAAEVVVEPGAGVDEEFPHVYGPITIHAVTRATAWQRDRGQPWRLPPDF